jgi:MFS-type transporter involved in bile tolerance (Atg22 family)
MNVCGAKIILGVVAGLFALSAAGFWFIASWKGFRNDLATQSRLNATAALCAGLAAILQIPLAWLPSCWG